jgi:predicted phosphoribosyltransferase
MTPRFRDRREAGRVLAGKLDRYTARGDLIVLALPRGGVPVAFEVARALQAPLDVFLVRKLGVPGQEELAMGAIAAGGSRFINWETVETLGVPAQALEEVIRTEERELARREQSYRGDEPAIAVADRIAILVDDGLATGSTMRVAVSALRAQHPARIVVAVPIAAPSSCEELAGVADETVCAVTPEPFYAVGLWYQDFAQTTDEEVHALLELAARERSEAIERAKQPPSRARSRPRA